MEGISLSCNTTQTFLFPVPREIVLNANAVKHYRLKGLCAKALREMAMALGESTKERYFDKYSIDVYVYAPSKRRIDPGNLYPTIKPLIDGLTDANLWEDDDAEHLTRLSFMYGGLSEMPECFIIKMIVKEET